MWPNIQQEVYSSVLNSEWWHSANIANQYPNIFQQKNKCQKTLLEEADSKVPCTRIHNWHHQYPQIKEQHYKNALMSAI